MQILVVSDSHGDYTTLDRLVRSKQKAEIVIFCGDGYGDLEEVRKNFPEKMFIGVRRRNTIRGEAVNGVRRRATDISALRSPH